MKDIYGIKYVVLSGLDECRGRSNSGLNPMFANSALSVLEQI
jgi:hypothetical protein